MKTLFRVNPEPDKAEVELALENKAAEEDHVGVPERFTLFAVNSIVAGAIEPEVGTT